LRVLLISYLFPPAGGITVQRAISLARYMPEHECEIHVLSARNAPTPVMDSGLLQLIPPSVQLHHAWTPVIPFSLSQKMWRLLHGNQKGLPQPVAASSSSCNSGKIDFVRKVLCPDPEVLWRPFCFRQAADLIKRHRIDVVLITAPPFSALLTGVQLKRKFPHITLVSDFRDGWVDWYVNAFEFFRSPELRKKISRMEREVVEASDLVVSVTASLREKLQQRYYSEPADKFPLLPNGFDPAIQPAIETPTRKTGKINVTYMGTLYGQTSARYYLDALDALPEEIRSSFTSHFIGRIADEELATQQNRRSEVTVHGFLPQAEGLRRLADADLLLVNMTDPLCHTGKIFEYLATGKPILAFTPTQGELAQLLNQVGCTWIVDPKDHSTAKQTLRMIAELYHSGKTLLAPDRHQIRRFERPQLTAQYVELIRAARSKG
jgi:glycosyltransferase involved in cell wall biosynthesis